MPLLLAIWGFVFLFVFNTAFAIFLIKFFIFAIVATILFILIKACYDLYILCKEGK